MISLFSEPGILLRPSVELGAWNTSALSHLPAIPHAHAAHAGATRAGAGSAIAVARHRLHLAASRTCRRCLEATLCAWCVVCLCQKDVDLGNWELGVGLILQRESEGYPQNTYCSVVVLPTPKLIDSTLVCGTAQHKANHISKQRAFKP